MRERIMAILGRVCGAEPDELEPEFDLFESGLLDSFGIVQLFVELEEQFGVQLDIEKLSRADIATPALIIALAERAL